MAEATSGGLVRRTQAERSTETRSRLLDATIECLIDLGYSATTTSVISQRAGVSRGAQLHHFPTRAELVAAAVEHLSIRTGEELVDEVSQLRPGENPMAAAVDLLWPRFSSSLFPAWLELRVASRGDAELRRHLDAAEERIARAHQHRLEQMFGEALGDAPGYTLAVELTLTLMTGLALGRAVAPPGARRKKKREDAMLAAWKRIVPEILGASRVPPATVTASPL